MRRFLKSTVSVFIGSLPILVPCIVLGYLCYDCQNHSEQLYNLLKTKEEIIRAQEEILEKKEEIFQLQSKRIDKLEKEREDLRKIIRTR
jgi:hypothetical protein